jgi:tetraacyldisaccharide 4'-kinase
VNEQDFRDLVSGRRRGLLPTLARGALSACSVPYRVGIGLRNLGYDRGYLKSFVAEVPVVSVGNLTLGGTGKTPFVEYVARWYRSRGLRPVILSRGYGAEPGGRNDEGRVLEQNLPDVPNLEDRDRVALARIAVEELEADLLILDDGFQHRRLRRDLDIVLLDATEPFGLGRIFPRGLLREPLSSLRRADVVVLSRADLCDDEGRQAIRRRVEGNHPGIPWVEAAHRPKSWQNADGEVLPLDALAGQSIAAFCGVGNPDAFRRTLEQVGCRVVDFRALADHFRYDRDSVRQLRDWIAGQKADVSVTTQKDLVKLNVPSLANKPLWALKIELDVIRGGDALAWHLDRAIRNN